MERDLQKIDFSLLGDVLRRIGNYIYGRFLLLYERVRRDH
jgi:hypothetical protein